jgi:hypothetical protein
MYFVAVQKNRACPHIQMHVAHGGQVMATQLIAQPAPVQSPQHSYTNGHMPHLNGAAPSLAIVPAAAE